MRIHRRASALATAGVALLLAATPASAIAPAGPASGHWVAVGPSVYPTFVLAPLQLVWNTRIGPDGRLYAFGAFANASGDFTADNLAVYDPVTGAWAGIGSNGAGDGAIGGTVYDIAWLNGTLFVAGNFTNAGGIGGANFVAAWNGTSWNRRSSAGALNGIVDTLAVQNGYLYAGGNFTNAGGDATADYVAVFDGYSWHGLASGGALDGTLTGRVWSLKTKSDGEVIVGGEFINDGPGALMDHVGFWDPASESWNPIGGSGAMNNAINGTVYSVALSGSRIYVGGAFFNAGGVFQADAVAMWSGTAWKSLGSSVNGLDGAISGAVQGVTLYGSNVIVTGTFGSAAGVAHTAGIAAWNGSKWLSLGSQGFDSNPANTMVSGRTLYASGPFSSVTTPADPSGVNNTAGLAAYGLPAAPSAPRSLTGKAGTKRVSLAWTAPVTANGATLRDYVVQYRKVGTTTWKTFADGVKTTRAAVVTGLASGTTYQLRVLARNDWGTGAASAIISRKAG
jgi:hypothetical protein